MYELIEILLENPDLPVLTLLVIFLIVRVNAIDRKVSAVRARLDTLEQLVLTAMSNHANGKKYHRKEAERIVDHCHLRFVRVVPRLDF